MSRRAPQARSRRASDILVGTLRGRTHINFSGTCLAHSWCSGKLLSSSSLYDRVPLSFIFLELNLSPSVYIYIYILCTQYLFIELSIYILSSFIVVCVGFVLLCFREQQTLRPLSAPVSEVNKLSEKKEPHLFK